MLSNPPLFSDHEIEVLTAICDTLAPALPSDSDLFYARKASDLNIPQQMIDITGKVADPANIRLMKIALFFLDQAIINAVLSRNAKSIRQMSLAERTALLQSWANSPLSIRRYAFQAFKRVTLFLFYSVLDESGKNLNWPAIGYPGPIFSSANAPMEKSIKPLVLTHDSTLSADAVVIGSGAGGGVVAAELAAAGLDVIVLEKGGYYSAADFTGHELASGERLFENRGFYATADLGVVILAASTLGGGTTINWSASIRTPQNVLDEWEHVYGVRGFTGAAYQQALDTVSQRMNVNTEECETNPQNAALERGSQALGYAVKTTPRNVKGCQDSGFCNFGCPYGAKQGTLRTFLQDAYDHGTRILVHARAERVLIENGKAAGVLATVQPPKGRPSQVKIRAKLIVSAAGALHTPALLMRSGLINANIGRNLHLHPTSVTYGMYDMPINGWSGPIISRYVTQFSNLDGHGYGVALETAPIHPGISAFSLPWLNGQQHKTTMSHLAYLGNIIIITRDRGSGQIKLDRNGNPAVHYHLSRQDAAHLMRGIIESLRIERAAGAYEVSAPHTRSLVYREGNFEDFLHRVQAQGLHKNDFALYSAHQMSSCRMGANPAIGAIDPTGETFEVRNLFVADASALPTASGVNPMLTIMGTAYLIAQSIKSKAG